MSRPEDLTDAARAQIKDYFIAQRGYWRPWTETMLRVSPGFVQQYARYAGHPARTGPLSERMVELIYVALDASSSHLFESGLHTHMKRALEVGATEADIFDVLHLVAVQGVASVGQAADILAELIGGAEGPALDEQLQARIDRLGPAHALRVVTWNLLAYDDVAAPLRRPHMIQVVPGLAPDVMIVNQTFARRFFGDNDPIGARVKQGWPEDKTPWRQIIGVVNDVRVNGLQGDPTLQAYLPIRQVPQRGGSFVLRTSAPPIISRISEGRVLLDLRTVFPDQLQTLQTALKQL